MVEHDEDKPSALCVQSMPCRHLGLWPGVFWAHMQTHLVAEADRDTNLDPCRAVCGLAPVSKHAQSLGQTDVSERFDHAASDDLLRVAMQALVQVSAEVLGSDSEDGGVKDGRGRSQVLGGVYCNDRQSARDGTDECPASENGNVHLGSSKAIHGFRAAK